MRKAVFATLIIVSLLLVSCGPAAVPGVDAQGKSGEVFLIALPRIVVDVSDAGELSLWGIPLADIGKLTGRSLNYRVEPSILSRVTAAKIQHVEVRQTGDRLALFVNAKPLPYIAWSDESLDQAASLAALFNIPNIDTFRQLLPIVRRLGLDVAVRFPRGAEAEIPLADMNTPAPAAPAAAQQASVMARFEIKYDQRGVPGILGVSAEQLAALGLSLPVGLDPNMIQKLQSQNIQNVEVNAKPSGVVLYVNGNPLPSLVWDQTSLNNVADLYTQLDPGNTYGSLIKMALPVLGNPDVAVLIHFPPASGAQVVPAKMH